MIQVSKKKVVFRYSALFLTRGFQTYLGKAKKLLALESMRDNLESGDGFQEIIYIQTQRVRA